VNALGATMDMRGVIPLDEHSLLDAARRNTGLDDFGDTEWLPHFRRLLQAMEEEARLNFFGRVLTRSDLLVYLEGRLCGQRRRRSLEYEFSCQHGQWRGRAGRSVAAS
jgi:hypothetical protein